MPVTTLQSKVERHLADKRPSWDGDRAEWTDADGAHVLVVAHPLTLAVLVDAVAQALERGEPKVTVAYEGVVGDTTRRAASRFGVALLDGSTLADPSPPPAALPPPSPLPLPPPSSDVFPPLPWSGLAPEPEIVPAHVDAHELLALPWHESLGEHHEVTVTPRRPPGVERPSEVSRWGLPWPRPVPPTDGLAIADPAIWANRDRVQAVRDGLEASGGGSFGAFRPEGSAWLKRLQGFP